MTKTKQMSILLIAAVISMSVASCGQAQMDNKQKSDKLVQDAAKLFAEKKIPESVMALREASTLNPKNGKVYQQLGDIYFFKGDLKNAKKSFDQAIALHMDDAELHNSLGVLAMKEGEANAALQEFTNALKRDPQLVAPNIHMGDMALSNKHLQMAVGFYKKALAVDPQNKQASVRLKQIELAMKKMTAETKPAAQG